MLGIFFSKDRREEVIEVEEESETVYVPDVDDQAKLMTQGQWMKGCPEGGEQSFLFSLYQELSQGECRCPNGCQNFPRQKRDFFPIFVSAYNAFTYAQFDCISHVFRSFLVRVPNIHQASPNYCSAIVRYMPQAVLLCLRRALQR